MSLHNRRAAAALCCAGGGAAVFNERRNRLRDPHATAQRMRSSWSARSAVLQLQPGEATAEELALASLLQHSPDVPVIVTGRAGPGIAGMRRQMSEVLP